MSELEKKSEKIENPKAQPTSDGQQIGLGSGSISERKEQSKILKDITDHPTSSETMEKFGGVTIEPGIDDMVKQLIDAGKLKQDGSYDIDKDGNVRTKDENHRVTDVYNPATGKSEHFDRDKDGNITGYRDKDGHYHTAVMEQGADGKLHPSETKFIDDSNPPKIELIMPLTSDDGTPKMVPMEPVQQKPPHDDFPLPKKLKHQMPPILEREKEHVEPQQE